MFQLGEPELDRSAGSNVASAGPQYQSNSDIILATISPEQRFFVSEDLKE
ncbi:hypothetical protein N9B24_01990 [bacterium]|nr:hypothetical protein [bacterium]